MKNALRAGELHPFSTAWSEGREPRPEIIETCALEECVRQGKAAIGWDQKYGQSRAGMRCQASLICSKGIGVALVMQGTAIPYLDMGGASIKMNDDGSFNLLVGATDLGTGSDTVLAQMAAEVLGVPTGGYHRLFLRYRFHPLRQRRLCLQHHLHLRHGCGQSRRAGRRADLPAGSAAC